MSETRRVAYLTTYDNPYNPYTESEKWHKFDEEKGYYTNNYLYRVARTSDQLSEYENIQEIERAIDEIIQFDLGNMYRKVYVTEDVEELVDPTTLED